MLKSIYSCYAIIIGLIFLVACKPSIKEWEVIKSSDGSAPIPRIECGFIEYRDQLYLIGGRGRLPVDIYDPATQRWRRGNVPPLEIHHFQPVVYGEYILIVGAMTGHFPNEVPIANILAYQPERDQWFSWDTIPGHRLRGSGGTVIYQDKIYWVGGLEKGHTGGHKSFFDEYDPELKQWRTLPDAPRERDHFQAVVGKDQLFVVGGRKSKAPYGTLINTIEEVDYFDFREGRWATLEEHLPTPRAGGVTQFIKGQVVIAGGEVQHKQFAHHVVEAWDVSGKRWVELTPLPKGRHGGGMAIFQNCLYMVGGSYYKEEGPLIPDLIRSCF